MRMRDGIDSFEIADFRRKQRLEDSMTEEDTDLLIDEWMRWEDELESETRFFFLLDEAEEEVFGVAV